MCSFLVLFVPKNEIIQDNEIKQGYWCISHLYNFTFSSKILLIHNLVYSMCNVVLIWHNFSTVTSGHSLLQCCDPGSKSPSSHVVSC